MSLRFRLSEYNTWEFLFNIQPSIVPLTTTYKHIWKRILYFSYIYIYYIEVCIFQILVDIIRVLEIDIVFLSFLLSGFCGRIFFFFVLKSLNTKFKYYGNVWCIYTYPPTHVIYELLLANTDMNINWYMH